MTPGSTAPLYLLPFDHRHSYVTGMFRFTTPLTADELWREILQRHPDLAILHPVIRLARNGFPLGIEEANEWATEARKLAGCPSAYQPIARPK